MRIDAHHHLWRYTPAEYGWIGEDLRALRRDFLLGDLRAAMRSAGVDGAVAVQARQTVQETDWLLALAEEPHSPVRGVVGWLPIAEADFPATLDRYVESGRLKGLRHVVQAESPGFLDGEDFNRGVSLLREAGLVYDILIYARQLPEAIRFVDRHPRQRFVLDHAGKPDIRNDGWESWHRDLRALAQRPNVACKLSGLVTEADPAHWIPAQLQPYAETVLEAYGPDRVMAGTDWPVLTVGCEYAAWWQLLERWTERLSQEEQAAVLGGTAECWYELEPGPGHGAGGPA